MFSKVVHLQERKTTWSTDLTDINERIRELLQHAYDRAPAIRTLMDEAGVAPADIQGADDLVKIPVLSKRLAGGEFIRRILPLVVS